MVKAKDSMRTKALEDIVRILRDHKEELCRNYGVRELGIFGSYVRGEQRPDSDVDILVDFDEVPSLLRFVHLENHLSDLLGAKVDLVTKRALKRHIGKNILEEAVFL
jgi:predicted nucleotidyltransferase